MKIEVNLVLCVMVEFASPQFTSSKHLSKTPCEIHGTYLVEQFFNVIFVEFQQSPPTCTCVQMCADQPTYCYPTGCYRKAERRKETSSVSSIQQDTKTVFLVDTDKDIISDLMGNLNAMASSATGNVEKTYQKSGDVNLLGHINPLKEIVFKYKRLPKLQMKYNLREQLKHARDKKADVDLSKTRWPINKQLNRQFTHQRVSNYLTPTSSETNQQETSKYFKRYLTKRENQIGLDINALYLHKDASNFTLETLIDTLIERGLEGANSTSRTSNSSKAKDNEDRDTKVINSDAENLQNETNEMAMTISLLENSNNNFNQTSSSTAAYFEMMTTLSKHIDKQNNLTMEVIGNLTGCKFNDILTVKSANSSNSSIDFDRFKIAPKATGEIKSTTDTVTTTPHSIPVINNQVTKSKQRIVRKLRNGKLN